MPLSMSGRGRPTCGMFMASSEFNRTGAPSGEVVAVTRLGLAKLRSRFGETAAPERCEPGKSAL